MNPNRNGKDCRFNSKLPQPSPSIPTTTEPAPTVSDEPSPSVPTTTEPAPTVSDESSPSVPTTTKSPTELPSTNIPNTDTSSTSIPSSSVPVVMISIPPTNIEDLPIPKTGDTIPWSDFLTGFGSLLLGSTGILYYRKHSK